MRPSEDLTDVSSLSEKSTAEKESCGSGTPLLRPIRPSDNIHDAFLRTSDPLPHEKRQIRLAILVTASISILITVSIMAGIWHLHEKRTNNSLFVYEEVFNVDAPGMSGCGTTVKEAIALDCVFDELSDLWLPKKCSRSFEAEYLRSNDGGPFLYWEDPKGERVIQDRSQYAGGAIYYSTTRDHLRHCEYNLYRFADSLATGALIGHTEPFAPHLHHCAEILGKFANLAPNIDNIDVDTISTFGFC